MENVASSVRISGDAIRTLSKLAAKLGQSKAQVIRQALEEMDERVFWSEVHTAFAREADPSGERTGESTGERTGESTREYQGESSYQPAEIHVWEQASATDFMDEKW
jgi:predicted transcriptional regulator